MALDMFNAIVPAHADVDQTVDPAIIVADLDTLQRVAVSIREMRVGHLRWAAGIPAITVPRCNHCGCLKEACYCNKRRIRG